MGYFDFNPAVPRRNMAATDSDSIVAGALRAVLQKHGRLQIRPVFTGRAAEKLRERDFTARDYMHATKRYIARYGKPVAFYSDKHTKARVERAHATL